MTQIIIVPVLKDNYSYLVHDEESGQTLVIDPSVAQPIVNMLAQKGWRLSSIINTHHHWDHTGGNDELKQQTGCNVIGFKGDAHRIPGIDIQWEDGGCYVLGSLHFHITHIPGHTLGHILLYVPELETAFCGDTLFSLGCGRLFEGTPAQLHASLAKIAALPGTTKLYCGHEYTLSNGKFAQLVDPKNQDLMDYVQRCVDKRANGLPTMPTSVALEKKTNPFLRCNSQAIRHKLAMATATDAEVFAKLRLLRDDFKATT